MNGKRIAVVKLTKPVPKKTKIVQTKDQAPPETGGSPAEMKVKKTPAPRRTSSARRSSGAKRKPTAIPQEQNVATPAETGNVAANPSDEAIRLRAYFISERRRRFALPGDADSDWLEARRQLLSESGPR